MAYHKAPDHEGQFKRRAAHHGIAYKARPDAVFLGQRGVSTTTRSFPSVVSRRRFPASHDSVAASRHRKFSFPEMFSPIASESARARARLLGGEEEGGRVHARLRARGRRNVIR